MLFHLSFVPFTQLMISVSMRKGSLPLYPRGSFFPPVQESFRR